MTVVHQDVVDRAPGSGPSGNPYAPPAADGASRPRRKFRRDEGKYATGFAVGFLFTILGVIILHFTGRPATKRGALHGMFSRFGIAVVVVLFSSLG